MRDHRTTLRFNEDEAAIIRTFALQEGLTLSEGIRRLLFWNRTHDFTLPKVPRLRSHESEDTK